MHIQAKLDKENGEMTLPSRHRIRNSNPDGLRPSTLPLGHGGSHNIESIRFNGEETFCFFEIWGPEWGSNPRSPIFQAGSFNHCTRAPAQVTVYLRLWIDRDGHLDQSEAYDLSLLVREYRPWPYLSDVLCTKRGKTIKTKTFLPHYFLLL